MSTSIVPANFDCDLHVCMYPKKGRSLNIEDYGRLFTRTMPCCGTDFSFVPSPPTQEKIEENTIRLLHINEDGSLKYSSPSDPYDPYKIKQLSKCYNDHCWIETELFFDTITAKDVVCSRLSAFAPD